MGVSRVFVVKGGAKKIKDIRNELREKLQTLCAATVMISGDIITFSKEERWAKVKGNFTVNMRQNDVEILYTRESQPTSFTYLMACVLFLISSWVVLGAAAILAWYFYDKATKDFDSAVENSVNVLSARG